MSEDPTVVVRDFRLLAPKFAAALATALNDLRIAGVDAVVFETLRSAARQRWLYAQGRTRPGAIVTNASSSLYSWHGYGLAVDVISASKEWSVPDAWFERVARACNRAGLDWGGDWPRPDRPHIQWGTLRASPSDRARALYAEGGLLRVWQEVGAI